MVDGCKRVWSTLRGSRLDQILFRDDMTSFRKALKPFLTAEPIDVILSFYVEHYEVITHQT